MYTHNFKAEKLRTKFTPLSLIAVVLSTGTLFSIPASVAAQSIGAELVCSSVTELSALLFVQRQNGAGKAELEKSTAPLLSDEGIHSIMSIAVDGVLAYPILSDKASKKKIGQFFAASMKLVCLDQYSNVHSSTQDDGATTTIDAVPRSTNEVSEGIEVPDWADPNYPDIDYSSFGFQGLNASGNTIHGYWGIGYEKDPISDEIIATAMNVSNWTNSAPESQFFIRCEAGDVAAGIITKGYLANSRGKVRVAYRLDGGDPVETRWLANQGLAFVKGKQAEKFIREVEAASSVFLRMTERDGEAHDVDLSLQGIVEVAEEIAGSCQFSLLDLTREDLRRVQSLLNTAGYNAGTPDGLWGSGSKQALSRFQEENGLEKTGIVDRASLFALGY